MMTLREMMEDVAVNLKNTSLLIKVTETYKTVFLLLCFTIPQDMKAFNAQENSHVKQH